MAAYGVNSIGFVAILVIFTVIQLSPVSSFVYNNDNHLLRRIYKPAFRIFGLSYVSWHDVEMVTGSRFRWADMENGCWDCGVNNTGLYCQQAYKDDCKSLMPGCEDKAWQLKCTVITYKIQSKPDVPYFNPKPAHYLAGPACHIKYGALHLQPRPDTIIFRNNPMEVCTFLTKGVDVDSVNIDVKKVTGKEAEKKIAEAMKVLNNDLNILDKKEGKDGEKVVVIGVKPADDPNVAAMLPLAKKTAM